MHTYIENNQQKRQNVSECRGGIAQLDRDQIVMAPECYIKESSFRCVELEVGMEGMSSR